MEESRVELSHKAARGYVIPAGPFNIVGIHTDVGMVGCGAFDVMALDTFGYPAARVSGVATVEDLLEGRIKQANDHAGKRGITAGMTGREALERM